jgi:hypothetical protein
MSDPWIVLHQRKDEGDKSCETTLAMNAGESGVILRVAVVDMVLGAMTEQMVFVPDVKVVRDKEGKGGRLKARVT